jgi:hypothetical protein
MRPHLSEQPSFARIPSTLADRDPARARRLTQGLRPWTGEVVEPILPPVVPAQVITPVITPAILREPRSGYRRNSIFHMAGNFKWQRLDSKQKAKTWSIAQSMERATKAKGKRCGWLGDSGLTVFNALLFRFHNVNTGRCDPSYDALQKVTGKCRETISKAIDRLESSGLLTVTRRMMRFKERVVCPVTGTAHDIVVVRQISNAYVITDPAVLTIPDRVADAAPSRAFPARSEPSVFTAALAGVFSKFTGAEPSPLGRRQLKQPAKHPLSSHHEVHPAG